MIYAEIGLKHYKAICRQKILFYSFTLHFQANALKSIKIANFDENYAWIISNIPGLFQLSVKYIFDKAAIKRYSYIQQQKQKQASFTLELSVVIYMEYPERWANTMRCAENFQLKRRIAARGRGDDGKTAWHRCTLQLS